MNKNKINVGLVGYSGAKFNEEQGKALVELALEIIKDNYSAKEYALVSGLTDIGIPAIGYRVASKMGWKTVGIACSEANEYDCYPVDEEIIEGDNWGDESAAFIKYIDILVRVGGGKQSMSETADAKDNGMVTLEFDLPEIKD